MLNSCGHESHRHYLVDGKFICPKCFGAIKNKVYYCEKCKEYHSKYIKYITLADNTYVCEIMGRYDVVQCPECRAYIYRRHLKNNMCHFCHNLNTYKELYKINRYTYNPKEMVCYDDESNKSPLSSSFQGIGVELEVDTGGEKHDMSEMTVKMLNDEVYCKRDGSLYGGFEIITYPHTYESFKKMNWENTFKELILNGYMSHDSNHCGLHVHMTRSMFTKEMIIKLMYFYEKYWDELIKFSRRDDDRARRWSGKYGANDLKACEYYYNLVNNKSEHDWRYKAVNLQKPATIEFRLMRGTLNYKSFMACVEFVVKIAENSAKVTDVDNLSQWLDGLSDNCKEYMGKRKCFGYDTKSQEEQINYGGDDLCA